jgi:hypothetical protein
MPSIFSISFLMCGVKSDGIFARNGKEATEQKPKAKKGEERRAGFWIEFHSFHSLLFYLSYNQ